SNFLRAEYPLEGKEQFYAERVQPEIERLIQADGYDEIVLWFEYDLFCQVNLWACLNLLKDRSQRISLVCPTDHPEITPFKGMGQCAPEHFPPLFEGRIPLSTTDFECGAQLWNAFVQEDLPRLSKLPISAPLAASGPAIQAHLERFPAKNAQGSPLQRFLIEPLRENALTERALVGRFLRRDLKWGMGDLQVFQLIKMSRHLLEGQELLSLSDQGKALLQ
ncbi:MAG: hypothetical protein AAF598_17055, partial [Bacteroidota bacterium]